MELGVKITLLDYRKLRVCLDLYLKNIIFKFKSIFLDKNFI
jgi:hypothetical protein